MPRQNVDAQRLRQLQQLLKQEMESKEPSLTYIEDLVTSINRQEKIMKLGYPAILMVNV